ncbi:unnamed protein product [Macrosiphum euphorbiae]|uniref:Mutator-like transposase domain-containing protein n=1 Tax=Macrosiphum euphorbiae TaxID=13131 RepID=A0AAV0Y8U6_9HEMI|nr:unnamed protein product [Macrosiphum euphorbiae]
MEADGVVEGFLKSLEMHGLKFNRLIGDGDSSVTKRLHEIQPNSKYPLRVPKFILKNIYRFRSDVTKAAKRWRNLNGLTISQKMKGIRKDLSNGPFHRLGDHTNCETYFCDSKTNERNLVPEAVGRGIIGLVLQKWTKDDIPFVEHAKWNPKCIFVLLCKGNEFIENVKNEYVKSAHVCDCNQSKS